MDIAKIRTALKAITLGIGFSIAAPAFGATGELLLRTGSEPGAACREVGNQVFVEVQVDNLSDAINGIQASMTYDDSVIALNIAASTEEAGWTLISLTDSGGSVLYAVIRLGGSVGPLLGTPTKVATLVFDVVDHGSTAIQLQNSNTLLTTSAMDPEIINGANLTRVDSGLVSVDGASAGNNGPVCEGTALSLSATVPDEFANPPYTFVWAGPDGFNSTDQSPEVSASATLAMAGAYTVTVTNDDGCEFVAETVVTVNASPTPTITSDPGETVCAGTPVTLDAGAGYASYLWSPGGEITQTIEVTSSGTYSVTVTDGSGCTGSDDITITVNANPTANAGLDIDVCLSEINPVIGGSPTAAGGEGPYTYAWTGSGASFLDDPGDANPTFDVSAAGIGSHLICVVVTDLNACISASDCATVEVQPCLTVNLTIQGLSGDPNNNPTPYGAPGGADLTRVVEFVLTDCGLPVVADNRAEPVTFAPDGTDGSASVVLRNVSTDAVWLSAREGHTLRRLVPVNLSSGTDVVAMTLISGDVRTATVMQDGLIDIVDFSILASRWNENIAADLSIGADVNGDGKQNTNDFTAMQINYFMTGDEVDGCGGMGAIGLPDVPTKPGIPIKRGKKEVSVRRLSAIAPDAVSADITGDGMVDSRDIRRFAEIHNLPILPEFEAKLRRLENGDSIRLITP
ncbi:MAG: hypothetical protein KF841_15980 [Phycisphaerae bacterium]|nr:hypothetical protein [Phycisphaerae bacterium]